MPEITRILSLAISGLFVTAPSAAAPVWECKASDGGQWQCNKGAEIEEQVVALDSQHPPVGGDISSRESEIASTSKPPATFASPEKLTDVEPDEAGSAFDEGTPPPPGIRLDAGLNWAQCTREPSLSQPEMHLAQPGRVIVKADGAQLSQKKNSAFFSGQVEMISDSERISAHSVHYDKNAQTVDAQQNVYFEQKGVRLAAERAKFSLASKQGTAEQVDYRLISHGARGTADRFQLVEDENADLSQVSYTTCPPNNEDWLLEASEMHLDQREGEGSAKHVTVRFKDVPIFYLPYVSFPIDDRRKTGFLNPQVGVSRSNGIDLSAPYYLNLAPDYDATLTPRLMSKRGLMLGTEFRYKQPKHQGTLNTEWLPNDREYNQSGDHSRGAAKIKLAGRPWHRWRYAVNFNYVSDDNYLDDLGSSLATTSQKHIERRADLVYQGDSWNLLTRVQKYQTVDQSIAAANRPYAKLPQILFNMNRSQQPLGLDYQFRAEYVYFDKDDAVRGSRFDLKPTVALPLRRSWGFLTPKFSARHTAYDLEDHTVGSDDSPSRTTATFSLDSGLLFERQTSWLGNTVTQTLEPRLFYLYTPEEDQSELPNFDSDELDFTFANIFRDNRFSGADRIGDANQLTAAITTRNLSDTTGEELFRASLGQIHYFSDREVQLASGQAADESSSSLIAELSAQLATNWKGRTGVLWDPHHNDEKRRKSSLSLHYNDDNERIFNIAYRHTEGLLEQTDLSIRWPLNNNIYGVGRWNYSLLHDQTLDRFVGIEYENCCWATRLIARQHRTSSTSEQASSVFLQLELKGLSSIGDRIDQFLERGILGYKSD